ncbi:MAG: hypothetical protein AABZ47_13075 [Planctomycetota bacterium]
MAHDNSIASLTEDWIIARIKAIEVSVGVPLFDPDSVGPWEGSADNATKDFADEFMEGERPRVGRVMFFRDEVEDLEAGMIQVFTHYAILLGWRNDRFGAAARRGDGTIVGINRVRDLCRYAIHSQRPDQTDGTTYTDIVEWRGSEIVVARKNLYILQCHLRVREVPV